MRRLAVLWTAVLLTAPAAEAGDIRAYDVRIEAHADRSAAVVVVVQLDDAAPGSVAIPLGFAKVADLRVTDGPAGFAAAVEPMNGQTLVRLTWPSGAPATASVTMGFAVSDAFLTTTPGPGERSTLPEDSVVFRHAIVNSQPARIRRYRVDLIFPNGMRAHAIREALPKLRKTEVGPRVLLTEIDARPGARLQVDGLGQGDAVAMQIELVPETRSLVWIVVGIVLSLLYLVYFRDLVTSRAD